MQQHRQYQMLHIQQSHCFLIQQGYLQRTPRGRIATLAAFRHLGVTPPKSAGGLFNA